MSVWSFFYMCVGDNKVFKKTTHLYVSLAGFDLEHSLLLVELQSLHRVQKGVYLCIAMKKK